MRQLTCDFLGDLAEDGNTIYIILSLPRWLVSSIMILLILGGEVELKEHQIINL